MGCGAGRGLEVNNSVLQHWQERCRAVDEELPRNKRASLKRQSAQLIGTFLLFQKVHLLATTNRPDIIHIFK